MSHIEYRRLDDLTWCLVEESTDNVLSDYQSDNDNNYNSPLIIIRHQKKILQQVDIFSSNKASVLKFISNTDYGDVKTVFEENVKGQQYTNHLSIKVSQDNTSAMEACLSDIFSNLLITGRPLRYYNCTFFLPLDLVLDSDLSMRPKGVPVSLAQNDLVENYKIIPPTSLLTENSKESGRQTDDNIAHAQAYEFFHSHIQDQLFETIDYRQDPSGKTLKPIVHHRLKETGNLTLRLKDKKEYDAEKLTVAQIEDVSLYEYYNGMLLLGIRVGLPENSFHQEITSLCWLDKKDKDYKKNKQQREKLKNEEPYLFDLICDDKSWWKSLVHSDEASWKKIQQLQIESWLRYTKLVRILYANFFEQLKESKIAPIELYDGDKELVSSQIKDEFSDVILYFIKLFLNLRADEAKRNTRLKQLTDERMFVHASYVLVGATPKPDTHEAEEFERLFSYALYVDQHTDGYDNAQRWAYDKDFLQQQLKQQSISRWKSISSLSGYTDYSTVFMGFTGWFQNPTARVHVPYVYAKIQIQILFYRLTLEHLDRCIGVATRRLKESKGTSEDFADLRLSLIEFTNEYWFRELTPQLQGKEITELMMKQQKLSEKYELIKDKLDRASDYSTIIKDFSLQGKAVYVGWIAAVFAVLTFLPSILDAYLDADEKTTAIGSLLTIGGIVIGAAITYFWKKRQHKKLGTTK